MEQIQSLGRPGRTTSLWATALVLLGPATLLNCYDATGTAEECSKQLTQLKDICPVGTAPKLRTDAVGECRTDGSYYEASDMTGGTVRGRCESVGQCDFVCLASNDPCPCGILKITRDSIECREDCADGCGNGNCDAGETPKSCKTDCADEVTTSSGGSGNDATGGTGGGSSEGVGGSRPPSGGQGGEGPVGTAGSDGTGEMDEGPTGCIRDVQEVYVIRDDGKLLYVDPNGLSTIVRDAVTAAPLAGVVSVSGGPGGSAGGGHGCAVLEDGTVWCWRTHPTGNEFGQLGNGTPDTDGPTFRATQVLAVDGNPLEDAKVLATSHQWSNCAITNSGNLYCWGDLLWVKNGGVARLAAPLAEVMTVDGAEPLDGVTQASVGDVNTCVVRAVGEENEVWCWGGNASSQLGQGDTNARKYPVEVPGFSNPTKAMPSQTSAIIGGSGAESFICAIDGGEVRCLGENYYGDSGIGLDSPDQDVTVPTRVRTGSDKVLKDVVDLTMAPTCALTSLGSMWCWGTYFGPTKAAEVFGPGGVSVASSSEAGCVRYATSNGNYYCGTTALPVDCGELE